MFDENDVAVPPILRLRTLAGQELGVISNAYDLSFELNYADVSTIQFSVPYMTDGVLNPIYSKLTSYKVIYTDSYGVYVLASPTISGDGIAETKSMTGYSLEKLFEKKMLFLEEGTYKFWDVTNQSNTVLGRILELDSTWSAGTIDSDIAAMYRTFDEYNENVLNFCYNEAPEKYECVFVFDPYLKKIHVYKSDADRGTLPIYLDYGNLVTDHGAEELTDEIVTKLHVYGSDGLSIRDVNPTGTDYIMDFSWFIDNGDLNITATGGVSTIAARIAAWKSAITAAQSQFSALSTDRNNKTSIKLVKEAELKSLEDEKTDLQNQQSMKIQEINLETDPDEKAEKQEELEEINESISDKEDEITAKKAEITTVEGQISTIKTSMETISSALAYPTYFSTAERAILDQYIIESTLEDDTFVAVDIDTSLTETSSAFTGSVAITDSEIVQSEIPGTDRTMYTITGGNLSSEELGVSGKIMHGTISVDTNDKAIVCIHMGESTRNGVSVPSGMLTMSGPASNWEDDIEEVTVGEVTTLEGTEISFTITAGLSLFSANVTEYQQYVVKQDLYNFGVVKLAEISWPTYEFSLNTANFLFIKEFAPYRAHLKFGYGVYVGLGSDGNAVAKIIGASFSFSDTSKMSLTFSNRYQKKNGVEMLADMIQRSYASSRNFDAGKYIYNQTVGQTSDIARMLTSGLDAAKTAIVGASNQGVVIDGSGIHVKGESGYKIRIVDSMIAMIDETSGDAKMALGLFATPDESEYFGINAEVLAGKLLVGQSMVLENEQVNSQGVPTGVMQFKVDASGAWLNNSTFIMQKDNAGKILMDPRYGILAGTNLLYTTSGTTITPSFIDEDGDIIYDADGMPTNSNFFLNLNDGSAYFRGTVNAASGKIGGWNIASGSLSSGATTTYVAMNSSADNVYAIWAGDPTPANAKFSVRKDGTLNATNGTFSGTLNATTLNGTLTGGQGGAINGCSLNIGNGNFVVTSAGNVTMAGSATLSGNINMTSGNITWGSGSSPSKALYARNELSAPTEPYEDYPSSSSSNWHRTLNTTYDYFVSYSYDGGSTWTDAIQVHGYDGDDAEVPGYIKSTYIDLTQVSSPYIKANQFDVYSGNQGGSYNMYGRYGGSDMHVLAIEYYAGDAPTVTFRGPSSAYGIWNFVHTTFRGNIDFSSATVSGLTSTATFG